MRLESLTRNQSVVYAALAQSQTPLTAYQILNSENARTAGLKAPLSVYRALNKLVEVGLVHRIEQLNAFVICDHGVPHAAPAVFMICRKCSHTSEVPADDVCDLIAKAARSQNFFVESVSIELTGYCADCAA